MNISFNDKTVVVTGGTKGIGKAIAELFLESGANVIVTGRSINKPLGLDSSIGYIPLNLESNVSIEGFLDYLTSLGQIDAFVNNAGINVIDE
jgi:3-oxoacyl-[acyl-carrier protein] reductase